MVSEQGLQRIRGVLRRRRRPVVATALAVLVVAALLIGRARGVYRAAAVVRALESQPSKEYVAPPAVEQVGERVRTLRLAVMARPILAEVADELHLDAALGTSRDEAIDAMRAHMEVKLEGDDTFLISYEDTDAARAREVVDRVATKFIARQVARREQIAAAAERALADEVARLRPELERFESRVRTFKAAHYGALPEQQEENLRTLDQTTMEINIQATNLDLGEEHRRQLVLGALSALRHQEGLLETALHEAQVRYTPEHPEVARVRDELERVHAQRVRDEKELQRSAAGHPELVALEASLDRSRAFIGGLRRRQAEVRARLGDTARNAAALTALGLDLDALRMRYQATIGKLYEAELARGVELRLRGLRYDLVEGAARPLHPVRPNKPLLALGAVLLAALAGLGAGFARDFADSSVWSPEELAIVMPGRRVEVLASVPEAGRGRRGDGKELL